MWSIPIGNLSRDPPGAVLASGADAYNGSFHPLQACSSPTDADAHTLTAQAAQCCVLGWVLELCQCNSVGPEPKASMPAHDGRPRLSQQTQRQEHTALHTLSGTVHACMRKLA